MPQRFHIDEDELVQYALGSLKDAQLTMLTAHVSICSECRARLGKIQVELAVYAAALPEEDDLPAGARQRFMARLDVPSAQEPLLEKARELSRATVFFKEAREWFVSPVALWALSGVLAATVIFLIYDDTTHVQENRRLVADTKRLAVDSVEYQELKAFLNGSNTQQVTLHQSAQAGEPPQGHVMYSPITGRLLFTAASMPQLSPGKVYALWLTPASGAAPIPAGTFVPDLAGNGAIILPRLAQNVPVSGFGVSIEKAGGAASPTLPMFLSGH